MAYTYETTHYSIPLPLASDLTTPMDYNTAMQAVDTALFGAVTDATAGVQKANAVEEALGTTNDNLSALTGRVTSAEGTITTQGKAITQLQLDVADTKADALDMICAVDEGTAQVATVAVQEGKYFRYNDVLYMATADIAIGDTIVPNTNCRATNVATELEAIAPSGETVDETARQEIGNLSNLQTTSKADLVSAINEVLSQIGGGGMPLLDFANPLHTFSSGNLTFTATKECYVCGVVTHDTTNINVLSINSTPIGTGANNVSDAYIAPLKIKAGDVVTVTYQAIRLHVFDVVE